MDFHCIWAWFRIFRTLLRSQEILSASFLCAKYLPVSPCITSLSIFLVGFSAEIYSNSILTPWHRWVKSIYVVYSVNHIFSRAGPCQLYYRKFAVSQDKKNHQAWRREYWLKFRYRFLIGCQLEQNVLIGWSGWSCVPVKGSRVARQEKSRVASSETLYIFISCRILPFLITTVLVSW